MSWKSRRVVDGLNQKQVEKMLLASDHVVSLDNDADSKGFYLPPPFKFSRLTGIGVMREKIGYRQDCLEDLREWLSETDDLVFGYFTYDVKNLLEDLSSQNPDCIGFPLFHLFVPETVIVEQGGTLMAYTHATKLMDTKVESPPAAHIGELVNSVDEESYRTSVTRLKEHIQYGDTYEVNYCWQHRFNNTVIEPRRLYTELRQASPAPFSCYVADGGRYLACASPERFIMKNGPTVVSQPMKGTNRRMADNASQKALLRSNAKELAENIMITDLVRNDLSKTAQKGSVQVDECCGVYEFAQVNQMISTVSSTIRDDAHPLDALLNAFPMGSMTGAPKIRAMELIEQYEDFSRGLFSGCVGYFTPELDFDFNVVIRSILYNADEQVVTFPAGGAITINSDPELEYEECLLKAESMLSVLKNHAR